MIMKIDVTDADFEKEVIEKSKELPVLVDFWAPWCGPCLMLGPVLEQAIDCDEFRKKVLLAKANTNECRAMAERYNIMAIPNVKLFKNGRIVAEMVGFRPLNAIKEWLRQNL